MRYIDSNWLLLNDKTLLLQERGCVVIEVTPKSWTGYLLSDLRKSSVLHRTLSY